VTSLKPCIVAVIALLLSVDTVAQRVTRARQLADDNLAIPVLITSGNSSGTGFFVASQGAVFLATAKHVLFLEDGTSLRGTFATARARGSDPKDSTISSMTLDLVALRKRELLKVHATQDIASIRIGKTQGDLSLVTEDGVRVDQVSVSPMTIVATRQIKRYAEVLVSNDAFVFGYPTSVGGPTQIDYDRPLLRRALVAGLNHAQKTIILDTAVYPGNSGGPVIEMQTTGTWRVIGLATNYVPSRVPVYELRPNKDDPKKQDVVERKDLFGVGNAGYAVAASMDTLLELIGSF
jgi:hypothetical protein